MNHTRDSFFGTNTMRCMLDGGLCVALCACIACVLRLGKYLKKKMRKKP